MPTYEYQCKTCGYRFDEFKLIKDREAPTKEPCPECGEKEVKQGFFTSPGMKMDANMDLSKPHNKGGFQDAMRRIADSPGVKGTKYADRLKAKHIS